MNKPSIYVINLARSIDRRESILNELRAVNVHHPRIITAYDGHAANFPFHTYQHLAGLFWGDPEQFKPGAFACYLSHAACWREIAKSNQPCGLILEDDVAIHAQPFHGFSFAHLPEDFDVIFISAGLWRWSQLLCPKRWRQFLRLLTTFGTEVPQNVEPFIAVSPLLRQLVVKRIFKNAIPGPGAYGYLVSQTGATKLLAMMHSRKICMGVDYAMVFQSLNASDIDAIRTVGMANLPKSLRFFLSKEEAHCLADGVITLNSYVYTPASMVTIKPFPSMLQHAVYLNNSRFYQ